MEQGDAIPAVTVKTAQDEPLALGDLSGPLVVYFYPKDDTSGCTREAQDFTALAGEFTDAGVRVIGISKDSPAKHRKFSEKHALTVELVSDEEGAACEAFGVWGEKQLYGKTYMGIERATFLFGRDGTLARSWRKVKVPGHAQAVLEAARAL
ncbi:peroxiredoxin [Sphingomonas sanguinis]|jgi:peroxiredoxin Q/BCP|uniref:thioredoxin-dependent peroxiredoxin n=1 Tax=Sphingomonas sanguinis TaxID=33051 RepID=A0A7Y7QSG6_9SPHN|nr:peroxiredoxin [Sphingomonas sanguinis]MBZ6380555.1 peroxiredoxin [Sphingomonas sanguinis]NNG49634.1 peroxiredoxin [Sphingomonas sanguinis]NNG53188.1 peroxiredoxin [Sphingomonas sanguinis]NVP29857.1 peroxiredoxin [Sphingomonas sanguinis]